MKNFLLGVGMFFASNIAVGLECYTYKIFEGKSALQEDLQSFINPRFIEMMHAYPYLYKMDLDEAQEIYDLWAARKHGVIIVAYDQGVPVGYIRGMSLDSILPAMVQTCKDAGVHVQTCYYISDVFVDSAYRHQGLCTKLFKKIEEYAESLGYISGCLDSETHKNHPLQPADYKEFDYSKFGYVLAQGAVCVLSKEIHAFNGIIDLEHTHTIDFWFKKLQNN